MQIQGLVLLFCLVLVSSAPTNEEDHAEQQQQLDEGKRSEFSRILRGGPSTFSRILRGGPNSFSRILRSGNTPSEQQQAFSRFAKSPKSLSRILRGGPSTFSRILKGGGPNSFSRILRAYYQQQQHAAPMADASDAAAEEAKRESFSRILRSSLSRIYKKSAEEPEWNFQSQEEDGGDSDEDELDRVARDPGFSRILRDPHFSRILRAQEFSRIL